MAAGAASPEWISAAVRGEEAAAGEVAAQGS